MPNIFCVKVLVLILHSKVIVYLLFLKSEVYFVQIKGKIITFFTSHRLSLFRVDPPSRRSVLNSFNKTEAAVFSCRL